MLDDLLTWTKEHLGALVTASDEEFERNFDSTYSERLEITINGGKSTREQVKLTTLAMRDTALSTQFEFHDMKKELKDSGGPYEEGTVHGSWTVIRFLKYATRAAPPKMIKKIQFIAKIESDPSVEDDDKRRIISLDETFDEHLATTNVHPLVVPPKYAGSWTRIR